MENYKGKNLIERMNDLMKYGNTAKPKVQEGRNWGSLEYSIEAPNGKTYGILRDQTKFYIKESKINNPTIQDFDFIGGVINGSKTHYKNYSHALNYLNLMIAEMNQRNPKSKGINLLECNAKTNPMEEEKEVDEKTVLKMPQAQPTQQPAPAMDTKQPNDGSGLNFGGDDSGLDLGGDNSEDELDLGGDDSGLEGEDSEDGLDNEDENTKEIQKLTGKLGQKMRDLEQPDSDLTKYVINSVLSALDLNELEPEDQKKILKKLKKQMEQNDELDADLDTEDDDELDLDNEEGDDTEDTGDELDFGGKAKKPKENEMQELVLLGDDNKGEQEHGQQEKSKWNVPPKNQKYWDNKNQGKINKTISKYFEYTPEEIDAQKQQKMSESKIKGSLLKEGKDKCKTIEQELSLQKVLNYDKGFGIKTMKENLVVTTRHNIILGGKEYSKLVMIESNGKVSGILKDVETKQAKQFRMNDKTDYINFVKLGK